MNKKNKQQILGMLLGLHSGDSLGATLEFKEASPTWNTHTDITGQGPFKWNPGDATDDTDLMMCVLRAIETPQKFSFDKLKEEMLLWYAGDPKDIGTTTIKGLKNLKAGLPLRECGFRDEVFQGNGSIMRVAPMVLLNPEGREEILKTQTLMTHGHELCVFSDFIFIDSLQAALDGASKEEIYEQALKKAHELSPIIYEKLKDVRHVPWEQLKTTGFCVDTLAVAYWALLNYQEFEEAIIAVANRGDDSDSCAAVAGALCGAFYGMDALPSRWVKTLEFRDEIVGQIERIFPTMAE